MALHLRLGRKRGKGGDRCGRGGEEGGEEEEKEEVLVKVVAIDMITQRMTLCVCIYIATSPLPLPLSSVTR